MKRLGITSLGVATAALMLSACGATATTASSAPPSTTTTTVNQTTGPVGTTFSYSGAYDVTLLSVTDPAQPDNSFDAAPAGQRLVGANFLITNTGKTAQSDDADTTANLQGTDLQTYQSSFSGLAGCTDFSSGQFNVPPGGESKGCVAFQVPSGVRVANITWQPTGDVNGTVTWTVSK